MIYLFVLIALIATFFKKIPYKYSILTIFISGLATRIVFLLNTTIYDYTLDAETQIDYIQYIFDNNSIPTIKLLEQNYSFYHPPLFHIICAIWLKICAIFTSNFTFELLTPLLLLINIITLIYIYKIINKLIPYNKLPIFIVTFIPTMIYHAHIVNNDTLLFMFIFMAIYYFIKWQENNDIKHIIIIGICCSLGMMTKFSIAILALSFGLIALYMLYKADTKKTITLIKQFFIFLLIFATGFWYNIVNVLNGANPFTMALPTEDADYRKVNLKNILIINKQQITDPFLTVNINQTTNKNDINYLFYVARTFLFGGKKYENYYLFCEILFIIFIFVILFGTIKLFLLKSNNLTIKLFKIYVALGYILHIKYIFESPFPCTFNARYITPQLIIIIFMLFYPRNQINNNIMEEKF